MIKEQCVGFYNTPALWKGKQFDIQQLEFPQLELDTYQPTPIPQNIRLGHQIEYIFKQLVENSKAYEVVLYNLPIRDPERTIGEIDFILKDPRRDKLIHVELTYKFYIINPEISDPIHRIVGPNRRDTFFMKMQKIKNVQFPLLHSEEGSKALNSINIAHLDVEHQCCFKAQLFQPFGKHEVDIGNLNKDCKAGYWMRYDDFNKPEFENEHFYMPTKSEWVIETNDQVAWKSHAAVIVDIKLRHMKENAPMVWRKKSNTKIEKLFVVWW